MVLNGHKDGLMMNMLRNILGLMVNMGIQSGKEVSGRAGCRACGNVIEKGQPSVYCLRSGGYYQRYYFHSEPQDCSEERQNLRR